MSLTNMRGCVRMSIFPARLTIECVDRVHDFLMIGLVIHMFVCGRATCTDVYECAFYQQDSQ